MALPGFTAAATVDRASRACRSAAATTPRAPALTPAGDPFSFCEGRELNRNYPHPEDCGRYISCDLSGRGYEMPCVGGLHFMQDGTPWGHCDYPHVANCVAGA